MNPQAMLGVSITLNVFTLMVAGLRFWILRRRRRSLTERLSDGLFAMAVLISTANVCGVCYKTAEEIKIRNDNKEAPPIFVELLLFAPRFLKMVYIFAAAYIFELYFLKAAFILFYWGLFNGMDWKRKAALYTTSALVLLSFLATLLLFLLWCNPISNNWSSDLLVVSRDAALGSWTVNSLGAWVHIATDIAILCLPLLILSTLRLRRPEMLALIFVFCMGGLSISASVARYAIIYPYIKRPPLTSKTLSLLELWGIVEMAAAVLAFSLPSFRVMCVRLLASSRTRNNRGNSSSGGNSGGSNPLDSGGGRKPHAGRRIGILDGKGAGSLATTWTIGGGVVDRNGVRRSRAPRFKGVDEDHDDMDIHDLEEGGQEGVLEDLEMGDISMMEIEDGCGSSAEGGSGHGHMHGSALGSDWKESQERLRPGSTETMSTGAAGCDIAVSTIAPPRVETYSSSHAAGMDTLEFGQLMEFDFFPESGAAAGNSNSNSNTHRVRYGDLRIPHGQIPPHVHFRGR
ncbi:hypothetical protein DFH27DRAFT_397574 [Peziza echinospora]|nr:hypothetical protein DFH27DRAFT_397574 [Peziza echinospora]